MTLKFKATKLLILALLGLSLSGLAPLLTAATENNRTTAAVKSLDDEKMSDDDADDNGDEMSDEDEDDDGGDEIYSERLSKANSMNDIYQIVFEDLEPKELKNTLAYTEKNFPGYLKSLEKYFLKEDPATIADSLSDVADLMDEKAEVGDNKEALADYKDWLAIEQLEVKSLMISWDIKAANEQKGKDKVVAKLKNDLSGVLDKIFKLKMAEQKKEVEEIEKELKTMKEKMAIREKSRAQIIKNRIKELTEPEDEMQW